MKSARMEKYDNPEIRKEDIEKYAGLENEVSFGPLYNVEKLPIVISRFGITYPDENYYIKRSPSRCFIIEYIESGEGYLCVNGELYNLRAQDAYIIHPGDYCEYYSSKTNPYKKLWVNFRSGYFYDFLKAYELHKTRVFHNVDLTEQFSQVFALENISNTADGMCLPASKILCGIVIDLAIYGRELEMSKKSRLAWQVRVELDHSTNLPTSLSDLERKFYRSRSEIIKEFKAAYGITPYAYLINLRIELAKNLLAAGDKRIKEIAEYLCFSSEYHFSNCFKERVGKSPREYKRSAQGKI